MEKVYLALYCPCTEESGFVTLSVHESREGALEAITKDKEKHFKEHHKFYPDGNPYEFKDWDIEEMVLLP